MENSSTRELEKVSYSQQYGATVTVKTLLVETPVEGKRNCQGVLSRKNRVEVEVRGRISKIRPQAFCILFKAAPVWILALSKENTSYIYLVDFNSFVHFNSDSDENKINKGLYYSLSQYICIDRLVFGCPPDDTVHLLSGSFPF